MKVTSLPLIVLLPGLALGGLLDKREPEADANAVHAAHQFLHQQKVVTKTTRVTSTHTAHIKTVTIDSSTTISVPTQPGFVAANAAITAQAHVRFHKPTNLPDIKKAGAKHHKHKHAHGKGKKGAHHGVQTKYITKVVATTTIHPTTTRYLSEATNYAACGAENLLGFTVGAGGLHNSTGNGTSSHVGINSVTLVAGSVPITSDTETAYACCGKCQSTAGCVGSQWRSGVCNLHVRAASVGQCNADAADYVFGSFYNDPKHALSAGSGLILSNGRCGSTWRFGGHKKSA